MIDQMTETRIEEIIEEENGCYCEMVHPDCTCSYCLTHADNSLDEIVEVF